MIPLFFDCKARPLWLTAALLLTLPTGALPMPSHATTIGTPETINFTPQTIGLECTITPGTTGALGVNAGKTLIGTEQPGGSRTSVEVFANFENAQVVLDSLSITRDTSNPYNPTGSTIYLSKPGTNIDSAFETLSLEITNSQTETITAGVDFSPETGKTSFDAGEYNAQLTLTCTTGGVK